MLYSTRIRKTALAAMLFLPLCLNAKEKTKKVSANFSVFGSYRTLSTNKNATEATRKKVNELFPGWMIATDKLNGSITDINGAPVSADGASLDAKTAYIIDQKLAELGVIGKQWIKLKQYSAPKADYINFKQVIDGHDVAFASLSFRFTKTGALARIQMKNYGVPEGHLTPQVTAEKAKAAAIKDVDGVTASMVTIDANWSWFPIPHAGGYTLHPAWRFTVKSQVKGSTPKQLHGYVDAITGALLYRSDDIKETGFDLTVKGVVYKDGTLNPATLEPLPDLLINSPLGTLTTDTGGLCSSLAWILPVTTDITLTGNWSTVFDYPTSTTPESIHTVTALGTTYTFPTTAPSSSRHINAYYHVNRVHNFMKSYWPTFTDMDFSLPTNVDVTTGSCNAYYDGTSINFYAANGTCNSFAEIGDIIYHEYGHGISDHFYTNMGGISIENGSLNEANSDVWGMSITHNGVLGQNCYVGNGGFIRRFDITPQVYPIDITTPVVADPHYTGMIIAGCWWDVGVNLGSVPQMTQLFTDVYYDLPDGPDGTEGEIYHDILIDALMADDNDANLGNGTPHYNQIVSAFARHGIYLEGESSIFHTEIDNPAAGAAIPVTGVLNLEYASYCHDLTLYYKVNGTGAWNAVPLALTGGSFSGSIPAQTAGATVEYYFVMHDALGKDNGYFPITCNPNMPSHEVSLPYQFTVGLTPAITYDFESGATGWTIGQPTDDATDGAWIIGVPHAFSDPTVVPIDVNNFAGSDHTPGAGQKCLMAGVGGNASTNTSVSEGTTTVLTPVFDLASYNKPVFDYWRWFSNDFLFAELKNDPWITQIRDASSPSNPWITVERTYQSDLNWRHKVVNIRQYLPSASKVQMRFAISDSIISTWSQDGQSVVTGDIDDFRLLDDHSHVGVADINNTKPMVSPNPADNVLNITIPGNASGELELYDVAGRKIKELAIDGRTNQYSITTTELAAGVYNLVTHLNNETQYTKVLVAH